MVISAFDRVTAHSTLTELPVRLEQSASRTGAWVRVLLLMPCALIGLAFIGWLTWHLATTPDSMALLADRPLAALQVAFGSALWMFLFGVPAITNLRRLRQHRRIEIVDGVVQVEERGFLGTTTRWSATISSFEGISHHIRASLSGLKHEVVLVNTNPHRSLTLKIGERVEQADIDTLKALLGLPEVPAKRIYDHTPPIAANLGMSGEPQAAA
ncbi:MAG: hypothetical protein ACK5JT_17930 [Hyphomicrobiaceae bacterium]